MADIKAKKPKVEEKPEAKAVTEENKENAQPKTAPAPKDEDEDPYAVSSDSDSDDEGPPPMINIGERAADLGLLKTAFSAEKQWDKEKEVAENGLTEEQRIGKETLTNLKGNFECDTGPPTTLPKPEREKLTNIDKEKYSKFKDRFEHLDEEIAKHDEEKRKQLVAEVTGVGAETLSLQKERFEKMPSEPVEVTTKQVIEIERSAADKRRVQRTFNKKPKQEEPTDCAVCGKMVYPVEKLAAERKVFHKGCFKCHKCAKSLSVTTYNSHEGKLLCKVHMAEIFHPEAAANMDPNQEEEERIEEEDEDEEYAVVSKPKTLDAKVVRAGLKPSDDLENLPTLSNVKSNWEQSVQQASKTEKLTTVEKEMFEEGAVKNRLSKFVDDGSQEQAPSGPKEELHLEVGASDLKTKWEAGQVETATKEVEDRSGELDELKKSTKIKERFKEKTGDEPEEDNGNRKSVLEQESIDTSLSHEARERFKQGTAFQEKEVVKSTNDDIQFKELGNVKERFEKGVENGEPIERTSVDVRCAELGNIKDAFEKGQLTEAEKNEAEKQDQIKAEFQKFKSERRKQELRDERDKELANAGEPINPEDADVRQCAEMSSIKDRFEQGKAFESEDVAKKRPDEGLEIKVAGKARQKFKQIDEQAPKEPLLPKGAETRTRTSPMRQVNVPEPINKRPIEEEVSDDEEDSREVRNLLSKFQNMGVDQEAEEDKKKPKPKRQITPPPADYRAEVESETKERDPNIVASDDIPEEFMPAADTKNLKARFEKANEEKQEMSEEKRKQIEAEFQAYKALNEQEKLAEPQEEEAPLEEAEGKEELGIGPEHAQKMAQKWEKIQRKEAKKAQKGTSGHKHQHTLPTPSAVLCFVCGGKVYLAEQMECDGKYCHRLCFRCNVCHITLRTENCAFGDGSIYCMNHHKQLFNNMARPWFDGRASKEA